MNRTTTLILGVTATIIVFAAGYVIYMHYAARTVGRGIRGFVDLAVDSLEVATRPLTEANAVLRYEAAESRFSIQTSAQPEQITNVTEAELAGHIKRTLAPQPKLFVIYQQADFPTAVDRVAFESRIRGELEAGGAVSVTFAAQQLANAKSLFE